MARLPKIAVAGLGSFGQLHAETLFGLGGAELSAVCDQNEDRARQLAPAWGNPRVFSSFEALLHARAADAVIIATRADSHVPLALQALEAGLDVFLEKPAGQNEGEISRLERRRRETGRVVMVDHICLFHSLVSGLLQRVKAKGFRAVNFIRNRPATQVEKYPEETPLHLVMVHDLYVAARMVEGAEPVEWRITEVKGPSGKIDMTWVLLRWADGRVATFQSHATLPPGAPEGGCDWLEVFGDGYHTRIDTNPAPWRWAGEQRTEWPIGLDISSVGGRPTGMLAEAQRSFIAAITGGTVPEGCRLEDAGQIQRWSDKLQKISGENHP